MHHSLLLSALSVSLGLFISTPVLAQAAAQGTFTAEKVCPANKRLTSDNPGNVETEIGVTYEIVGKNKDDATHYLIVVPESEVTDRRWVDIACGTAELTTGDGGSDGGSDTAVEMDSIENVLAASWQPAFCATDRGKTKVECQTQTADRPDATQFSIHGLWPDDLDNTSIFPCYCDNGRPVSCRRRLNTVTSLDISPAVRDRLDILMPGTQSGLHLHEWSKHGSCFEDFISGDDVGSDADEYYLDTMVVIEQLNASKVRDLFVSRLGQEITFAELQAVFNEEFGEGAGDRVVMNCQRVSGDNVISELWIGLDRQIDSNSSLADLILAAPTTANSTTRRSCQRGLVVAVE